MIEKKWCFVFVFLLVVSSVSAVTKTFPSAALNKSQSVDDYPVVTISELKYEPYPVEPGQYFTMWLLVSNIGEDDAYDVNVELLNRFPFFKEDNVYPIGKIPRNRDVVIKFDRIKVNENAAEGDTDLEAVVYSRGYGLLTKVMPISVKTVNPIISLDVDAGSIAQGSIGNVSINLRNDEDSTIKDITVKLDLPEDFVPIGSTSEKKISQLMPGTKGTVSFNIMASGDAEAKAYKIPFDLVYYDYAGDKYNINNTFGLLVGNEPDYVVNIEESDPFTKNSNGKFVVSVANTGPSAIKYMVMELKESDDYIILSNSKSYIGNLDPDDFETAEFEIYPQKNGLIPVKLGLSYKDNFNRGINIDKALMLRVYSSYELSRFGIVKANTLRNILYAVIIIFIYLAFKEWRKEKDIGKAMKNSIRRMILFCLRVINGLRWRNLRRLPRKIKLFLS